MKTETKVVSETEQARLGYFDHEAEEWIEIVPQNISNAAETLACSEELLDALLSSFDLLKELITVDLESIWKRIDAMQ